MDTLTIIIAVVVFGLIVGIFFFGGMSSGSDSKKKKFLSELNSLKDKLLSGEIEPSFAIIKADTILDKALKLKSKGNSMGERLKNSKTFFRNDLYNQIWECHKIRNRIVHENIEVSKKEASNCLTVFYKAINQY